MRTAQKLLNISLMIEPHERTAFQRAMIRVFGNENYRDVSVRDPNLRAKARRFFAELKPDIVFFQAQCEGLIEVELVQHFRDGGAYAINWTGDKRACVPQWMVDLAPFVDCTAFSNLEDVRKMEQLGFRSRFLDIGYDAEVYTPVGHAATAPEVVFMANHFGDNAFPLSRTRRHIVEFLTEVYGARFGVFGSGWQCPAINLNRFPQDEAAVYRGAKIAINCSHFDCESYNSDRLLRILGCGTMCLSFPHVGMSRDYFDGTHLVYFDGLSNLRSKIDHFLAHPKDRQTIARNGNQLVRNRSTFEHMVDQIRSIPWAH